MKIVNAMIIDELHVDGSSESRCLMHVFSSLALHVIATDTWSQVAGIWQYDRLADCKPSLHPRGSFFQDSRGER
jgi:hypothetical protein